MNLKKQLIWVSAFVVLSLIAIATLDFRSYLGLLMLFGWPLLVLTMVIRGRKEILANNKKGAQLLVISLMTTAIFIVLYSLLIILNVPGVVNLGIFIAALSILTFVIGAVYCYLNPRIIGYELALIFLPSVTFFWHIIPMNNAPQLRESYGDLITAYMETQDSLIYSVHSECDQLLSIEELESEYIHITGGITEDGLLVGFNNRSVIPEFRDHIKKEFENDSLSKAEDRMLDNCNHFGEMLLCLKMIKARIANESCPQ